MVFFRVPKSLNFLCVSLLVDYRHRSGVLHLEEDEVRVRDDVARDNPLARSTPPSPVPLVSCGRGVRPERKVCSSDNPAPVTEDTANTGMLITRENPASSTPTCLPAATSAACAQSVRRCKIFAKKKRLSSSADNGQTPTLLHLRIIYV
jgi:hypothetical protein